MNRLIRVVIFCLAPVGAIGTFGCGDDSEDQPTVPMAVPDIPPGREAEGKSQGGALPKPRR